MADLRASASKRFVFDDGDSLTFILNRFVEYSDPDVCGIKLKRQSHNFIMLEVQLASSLTLGDNPFCKFHCCIEFLWLMFVLSRNVT